MPPRTRHSPTEPSTPAIGHNSQIDDDALIAENFRLEEEIKAAQAKLAEWAKPRNERIKEIEAEIRSRLLERKSNSTKTESGTAYFSDIMSVKVEDQTALFDFMADNWEKYGSDMIKLGAKIDTVRQYMIDNEGKLPPGLSNSFYKNLNIKRS